MSPIEILAEEAAESTAPMTSVVQERRTKPRRLHALSLKDHARLLLPFLAAGILGGVARLKYPYWWPANDLVYFLADSLIVAMVLGVALDLFSVRLLVDRVSDGLAQRLIGRGLPSELQASIRDIVCTELVRDHYVKSYAFSTPEDGSVQVNIEIRYEVKNYSEAVCDYAPEIAAEIFLQPSFRLLEYGIAGRKIYTFSDDLASKVETVDELNLRRVPSSALPPVRLKPIRTGEKAVCQVTWRYSLTMPEEYCDVTEFDEATLGATLQLETLSEELEFVSGGDASLHHEAGSRSWYFDKAFLTGQYLHARWFRRMPSMRSSRPSVWNRDGYARGAGLSS
jgi:hypothetical protein